MCIEILCPQTNGNVLFESDLGQKSYHAQDRNKRYIAFSIEKAKGMSCYICEKCYRISKEKLVSCPKCGATSSYVLPDELGASRAGAQPTGADTGGIMPQSWEDSSPPLSIISVETEKEKEKKRHKNKKVR